MSERLVPEKHVSDKLKVNRKTLISLNTEYFHDNVNVNTPVYKHMWIRVPNTKKFTTDCANSDPPLKITTVKQIKIGNHGKQWEIHRILDHRVKKGVLEYKIEWNKDQLFPGEAPHSWERESNLGNARDALDTYHQQCEKKRKENLLFCCFSLLFEYFEHVPEFTD